MAFWHRQKADEQRPPPEDCLECKLIGSGAMFSLAGYFFWQARAMKASPSPSHLHFTAAMGAGFAAAGLLRLLA